jgi:hypothetical protein
METSHRGGNDKSRCHDLSTSNRRTDRHRPPGGGWSVSASSNRSTVMSMPWRIFLPSIILVAAEFRDSGAEMW